MDDYLVNLFVVQIVPFLYAFFCLLDYLKNQEDYHNYPQIKEKSLVVAKNVFLYLPVTHFLIFSLFPHQVIFKDGFKELMFLVLEIIFADIYFYYCADLQAKAACFCASSMGSEDPFSRPAGLVPFAELIRYEGGQSVGQGIGIGAGSLDINRGLPEA